MMKILTIQSQGKGVTMITGHIYPDGNGEPMMKPDGDGCRAVDTATVRSVDVII